MAGIVPGTTGTLTATYTYDGNGNLLTGNGRTVTWTSFDMVDEVTQGANSLGFTYDSERNRLKQVSSDGSVKYYLNDPISGIMAEKIIGASLSVTWNDYIMVGAEMVALKVSGAATQIRYFHKDHLGSITALTDETGAIAELNSFDAWGQRRNPMGPDDPLFPGLSITSQITRGFTGHEQLDQVGLIHMNGRIYDPIIGKMMSADPFIQNPYDGQSYNRYAYVQNNPLSLTDPTGFRPDDPRDRNDGGRGKQSNGRDDRDNTAADRKSVEAALGGTSGPAGDGTGGALQGAHVPIPDARVTNPGFRHINRMPGGHQGPTISFENDVPGGPSTDNPVTNETADMVERIVRGAGVDININSTTGGHLPPSRHVSGQAVDIDKINGNDVSAANTDAQNVQDIAADDPNIRENFGPFRIDKTTNGQTNPMGTPGFNPPANRQTTLRNAHQTHIHLSGQQ